MASSTPLTSAQVSLAAKDKPLLLGSNRLRAATSAKWTTTGADAAADQSATGSFTSSLWDGYGHLISKPNADAATWWLNFNFGAPVTFDAIWIHGIVMPTTVMAECGDDPTFTTRYTMVTDSGIGLYDKRASELVLDHLSGTGRAYTAQYLRIRLTRGGGAFTPSLLELFVSSRRQLKELPAEPWADESYLSRVRDKTTEAGVRTRQVKSKGARRLAAQLDTYEEPYRSDLPAFWHADIDQGTKPFVWIDRPGSAPDDSYLMSYDETELDDPWVDAFKRSLRLVATEQGPYFRALEV